MRIIIKTTSEAYLDFFNNQIISIMSKDNRHHVESIKKLPDDTYGYALDVTINDKIIIPEVHLIPDTIKSPYQMYPKAEKYVIEIYSDDDTLQPYMIASMMHDRLCGLKEYVDSDILLNYDDDIVFIAFDKDSEYLPVVLFNSRETLTGEHLKRK